MTAHTLRVAAIAAAVAVTASLAWTSAPATADSVATTCTLKSTGEARPCDAWFPGDVSVVWNVVGVPDASTCPLVQSVTTEGLTPIACTVTIAGVVFGSNTTVKVDKTPPTVTGATARTPDADGWFNRPVTVSFAGSDTLSGIVSCSTPTYAGPDGPSVSVTGTCTDAAGLVSAPFAFGLKYDASPPELALRATPADRLSGLSWSASSDAAAITVVRRPGRGGRRQSVVYSGPRRVFNDRHVSNGHTYTYTATATDAAGNAVSRSVAVRPGVRLLAPTPGTLLREAPILRWTRVLAARYYNVQLFRVIGGRLHKVRSSWPAQPQLAIPSSWRYAGRARRLTPGLYRWYVWPGLGERSARRFGQLIGHASFTVAG